MNNKLSKKEVAELSYYREPRKAHGPMKGTTLEVGKTLLRCSPVLKLIIDY